jgi:uncharacterized protein (DUF433 family)
MDERIVRDSRILLGKPVVAGTRIPVYVIFNLLRHDYDVAGVAAAYPDFTVEDVRAAIRYAEHQLPGVLPQAVAEAV